MGTPLNKALQRIPDGQSCWVTNATCVLYDEMYYYFIQPWHVWCQFATMRPPEVIKGIDATVYTAGRNPAWAARHLYLRTVEHDWNRVRRIWVAPLQIDVISDISEFQAYWPSLQTGNLISAVAASAGYSVAQDCMRWARTMDLWVSLRWTTSLVWLMITLKYFGNIGQKNLVNSFKLPTRVLLNGEPSLQNVSFFIGICKIYLMVLLLLVKKIFDLI